MMVRFNMERATPTLIVAAILVILEAPREMRRHIVELWRGSVLYKDEVFSVIFCHGAFRSNRVP
jgi:hypothetical protein